MTTEHCESNFCTKGNPAVTDLRSAIEFLQTLPGQLVSTDVEVDPKAELSGVYRYVGAGGTCERPTRLGPAMMFNRVRGFPDVRVVTGILASRAIASQLFAHWPTSSGSLMTRAPVADQLRPAGHMPP